MYQSLKIEKFLGVNEAKQIIQSAFNLYDEHKEKALREYNSTAEYMEKLKQEIENTTE